ncbi:uncharacterized protein LOC101698744 [Heterocephalus glaber]|uniref:Uncharacterized protein LOC101698744 n=1 Tax=Heterocephalus glaber TaxID=10181 RepID=A0AAX6S797_HETGA|nr:uncharacterized protein LOC101698744 [Heterocephalus glaber]
MNKRIRALSPSRVTGEKVCSLVPGLRGCTPCEERRNQLLGGPAVHSTHVFAETVRYYWGTKTLAASLLSNDFADPLGQGHLIGELRCQDSSERIPPVRFLLLIPFPAVPQLSPQTAPHAPHSPPRNYSQHFLPGPRSPESSVSGAAAALAGIQRSHPAPRKRKAARGLAHHAPRPAPARPGPARPGALSVRSPGLRRRQVQAEKDAGRVACAQGLSRRRFLHARGPRGRVSAPNNGLRCAGRSGRPAPGGAPGAGAREGRPAAGISKYRDSCASAQLQ